MEECKDSGKSVWRKSIQLLFATLIDRSKICGFILSKIKRLKNNSHSIYNKQTHLKHFGGLKMQIPKRIELLIQKREKLALKLDNACQELDEWLDKHHIDVPCEDVHGGCEIYANPQESADSVRKSIINH